MDGPSVYGYARQSPLRWTDPTGQFQACFLGPVPCVASVGVNLIGAAIIYLNKPDIPSGPPNPKNSGEECEDDDCQEIYRKIRERVNELKGRLADLQENRHSLPLYGRRMTVESHISEYFAKQKNLRRLIGKAKAKKDVIIMTKKPTY